jgi:hypothetical protein
MKRQQQEIREKKRIALFILIASFVYTLIGYFFLSFFGFSNSPLFWGLVFIFILGGGLLVLRQLYRSKKPRMKFGIVVYTKEKHRDS